MLSVAEAFSRVLATAAPRPAERVPLLAAAGRVLREDLRADRDFPPFDRVTMDGIALRFADLAGGVRELGIAWRQLAGQAPRELTTPGQAVEIMTGAALPPGTDTVVRYEDLTLVTDAAGRRATVLALPPRPGHNVHPQGQDRRQGAVVLAAGTRLGPAELAVAATVGAVEVLVTCPARLALVSTGDELVAVEATPLPHQIRRSNVYALHALLTAAGATASVHHLPDDLPALRAGLAPLLGGAYDAVVLSGAVSQGQADFVPQVLGELGVREIFHQVRQRPGKPLWFGQHDKGTVVFGLPGNPNSTLLTAYRYVRPWLRATEQADAQLPADWPGAPQPAVLAEDVHFRPPLTYWLPVRLTVTAEGQRLAQPAPTGGSGDLAGLLGCQAFLELPAEEDFFAAGRVLPCWGLEVGGLGA